MAKNSINDADFIALLKKAYENAHGDIMRFWDLLNGFSDPDMREYDFKDDPKEAFIFVNHRKGAYGEFTAYVARFERKDADGNDEKVDYDVNFRSLKKPKFNGFIKIKRCAFKNGREKDRRKMVIYDFDFEKSAGIVSEDLGEDPEALPF